jgi:glutamate/tyrosine decarboxylase-like PLP-dependent enzyme
MRYLGADGYLRLAEKAMMARAQLFDGLTSLPELSIVGEPDATVVAIGSQSQNVLGIAHALRREGWHVQQQQNPLSLHLTISAGNLEVMGEFIGALGRATKRPQAGVSALQPYGDGDLAAAEPASLQATHAK